MKTAADHTSPPVVWGFVLFALLVFRTLYGLCAEFWFVDEKQIYLLGLKYFTTGQWPFFGPDVVYTQSQIPGALQALLVALPLFLLPLPEAPTIFLNLLSFAALTGLAWYLSRRFPDLPRWWVWIWPLTCPWAMVYSTRVVNPSYALVFSIIFFIAFWETLPHHREKLIPARPGFALMGLAIAAVMQLHLSWAILVPLAGASLFFQSREDRRRLPVLAVFFLAGFLAGLATLIPTLIACGFGGTGGIERNVVPNFAHVKDILLIVPRFLYFAAFQIHYMFPDTWASLLQDHPWRFWVAAPLEVIGWGQLGLFLACFFLPRRDPEWTRIRRLVACTTGMVCLSFFFSVKEPSSHTFYILFPLAMLYSFHCYRWLMGRGPWVKRLLAFSLAAGFLFHGGQALDGLANRSLYVNRAVVVKAIEQKDYRIMGLRRADEWGHGY